MNANDCTTQEFVISYWKTLQSTTLEDGTHFTAIDRPTKFSIDLLRPLRRWLDSICINNSPFAHALCQRIPSQCPFERDVVLFGRKLFHIPPLCKLNPLYEEVVALRFRALCYLADECGEDVTCYC
jgi:hypothetical protein